MFPVYAVAELALKQNVPVLAGGAGSTKYAGKYAKL
jgi:hypothetical protein